MDSVNWEEIRHLLTTLDQTSVVELILEDDSFRLTIRKANGSVGVSLSNPSAVVEASSPAPQQLLNDFGAPATAPKSKGPPNAASHLVDITSPMVGTFYSAPAPGEDSFVNLGDRVQRGQTLCIIEAMKLMNELEAETAGRLAEILVENGQPVEFGQVLMRIDPEG